MKDIKKINLSDYPGIELLTPLEMNKIHFETGRHTTVSADSVSGAGVAGTENT